jgi:hypothetical protein
MARGGAFETNCTPREVLDFAARCTDAQVAERSERSVSLRPRYKDGRLGPGTITVVTMVGQQLRTGVSVRLSGGVGLVDGTLNLDAVGPITSLIMQVMRVDPGWMAR